jgi:hypothetical protein
MVHIIALIKVFCHGTDFDHKKIRLPELFEEHTGMGYRLTVQKRRAETVSVDGIGNLYLTGNKPEKL